MNEPSEFKPWSSTVDIKDIDIDIEVGEKAEGPWGIVDEMIWAAGDTGATKILLLPLSVIARSQLTRSKVP